MNSNEEYNESDIQVLEGLEAVRKRPELRDEFIEFLKTKSDDMER